MTELELLEKFDKLKLKHEEVIAGKRIYLTKEFKSSLFFGFMFFSILLILIGYTISMISHGKLIELVYPVPFLMFFSIYSVFWNDKISSNEKIDGFFKFEFLFSLIPSIFVAIPMILFYFNFEVDNFFIFICYLLTLVITALSFLVNINEIYSMLVRIGTKEDESKSLEKIEKIDEEIKELKIVLKERINNIEDIINIKKIQERINKENNISNTTHSIYFLRDRLKERLKEEDFKDEIDYIRKKYEKESSKNTKKSFEIKNL